MFHSNSTTMKITESAVQLSARHTGVFRHTKEERLTVRVQPQQQPGRKDDIELSDKARAARENEEDAALDPAMRVAKELLERITGKKIRLASSKDFERSAEEADRNRRPAVQMEYTARETLYDAEATTMEARGLVKTADGRELSFTLSMSMAREFISETSVSVRTGTATDPLVINYAGNAADLTDQTFRFDLDADGDEEHLHSLRSGSGFLALDRNGDGRINDGSELFGPRSGNGFDDLRAYDADGNSWIDENDAIFDELRIWARDHAGRDTLHTLRQHDIGALFLGSTATPFSIRDMNNSTLGEVASSGVFLREDGTAGTIQQVNLVI